MVLKLNCLVNNRVIVSSQRKNRVKVCLPCKNHVDVGFSYRKSCQ